MSGPVTVTVDQQDQEGLKLKSATLATGTLKCTTPGVKSLTLKPSASVKRALAKVKKAVKVKLTVTLKPAGAHGAQGHGEPDLGPQVTRKPLQGPE